MCGFHLILFSVIRLLALHENTVTLSKLNKKNTILRYNFYAIFAIFRRSIYSNVDLIGELWYLLNFVNLKNGLLTCFYSDQWQY